MKSIGGQAPPSSPSAKNDKLWLHLIQKTDIKISSTGYCGYALSNNIVKAYLENGVNG